MLTVYRSKIRRTDCYKAVALSCHPHGALFAVAVSQSLRSCDANSETNQCLKAKISLHSWLVCGFSEAKLRFRQWQSSLLNYETSISTIALQAMRGLELTWVHFRCAEDPADAAAERMWAALPPPATSLDALCTVSLHFGMCLSAVSSANRLPQCGQGTKACIESLTLWRQAGMFSEVSCITYRSVSAGLFRWEGL